jgi:hypothetical protein
LVIGSYLCLFNRKGNGEEKLQCFIEPVVCEESLVCLPSDEALLSGFQLPLLDSLILGEEMYCLALRSDSQSQKRFAR